ncbi:MAG: hypothetical protein KAH84_06435 [Thiomargarita sp.]|nr:hypothetical protein [Thiomargarita sp.]
MTSQQQKSRGTVLNLALFDLFHEWILTLCLVLAIAAVIAPILLLLGLKYGTIATLRDRLVQDPVYREIRPTQTYEYKKQWFTDFAERNDIAFLTPTILPAASIITVKILNSQKTEIFDLIPTGMGDPLILENGGQIPKGNQCVMTKMAAEEIGVAVGDNLSVRVTRNRGGRQEFATAELEIVSILNPRAGILERIYTPLNFVVDVENYKEGMAIPTRNWTGGSPRPYLSFDGIIAVLPQKLDLIAKGNLRINTGVNEVELLANQAFAQITGFNLPTHLVSYHLHNANNIVQASSYRAVKRKLRGKKAIIIPYVKASTFRQSKKEISVFGLSLSPKHLQTLGLSELPWGALKNKPSYQKIGQLLLPNNIEKLETVIETSFAGIKGTLTFPLRIQGKSPSQYALVPIELLATLRTGLQREIIFDDNQQTFLLARGGYGGFRLYAKTIDDVQPIYTALKQQNLEISAKVDAIERIRILDRGLTRIFWLVAIVGIIGGIAALIASLYAAVERKKRDLSIMRLLGLSRYQVFRFPIYQALAMAILSIGAAISAYFTLSLVINLVFSNDLEMGQKICYLPASHLVIATLLTVSVAFISALLAAWKTTQIDPAEALREE